MHQALCLSNTNGRLQTLRTPLIMILVTFRAAGLESFRDPWYGTETTWKLTVLRPRTIEDFMLLTFASAEKYIRVLTAEEIEEIDAASKVRLAFYIRYFLVL